MMLPGAVTMIPIYLIWKQTGLLGTWVPLWGMNLFGSAFYIFLQRQFFLGLPKELFEAARLDGASYWGHVLAHRDAAVDPVVHHRLPVRVPGELEQPAGRADLPERRQPVGLHRTARLAYAMTKYSPTSGGHGDYQYVMVAALRGHRADADHVRLRAAVLHRGHRDDGPQGLMRLAASPDIVSINATSQTNKDADISVVSHRRVATVMWEGSHIRDLRRTGGSGEAALTKGTKCASALLVWSRSVRHPRSCSPAARRRRRMAKTPTATSTSLQSPPAPSTHGDSRTPTTSARPGSTTRRSS